MQAICVHELKYLFGDIKLTVDFDCRSNTAALLGAQTASNYVLLKRYPTKSLCVFIHATGFGPNK